MEEEIRGASSEVPRKRPGYMIAGVIRGRQDTQLAVDELSSLGFSERSMFVLHGESGAESLRHRGEAAGWLYSAWTRFDEFANASDDFVRGAVESAEAGEYVLGIELKREQTSNRDTLLGLLKSHGARHILWVNGSSTEALLTKRED